MEPDQKCIMRKIILFKAQIYGILCENEDSEYILEDARLRVCWRWQVFPPKCAVIDCANCNMYILIFSRGAYFPFSWVDQSNKLMMAN